MANDRRMRCGFVCSVGKGGTLEIYRSLSETWEQADMKFARVLPCAATICTLWLACGTDDAIAEIKLASPFTNHMVLQRELPVPVWGTADAGAAVNVSFAGQSKSVQAGDDGKWKVTLDPLEASFTGQTLSVSLKDKDERLKLEDVLVGEVWLCSGQSNMDFTVAKTPKYYFAGVNDEAKEVAGADYPTIRMFSGQWARSAQPQEYLAGTWKICNPENVREFSAIGYFFARDLQRELHVPIGIVTVTYGASTAHAWIRREAIAANPQLKPVLDQFDAEMKSYKSPDAEELKKWEEAAAKARSRAAAAAPAWTGRSLTESTQSDGHVQRHDCPDCTVCHSRGALVSGRIDHTAARIVPAL